MWSVAASGAAIGDRQRGSEYRRARLWRTPRNIEVAVLREDSGIQQFVFRVLPAPPCVFFHEAGVWKFRLRILVQRLQVRVGGRAVEVEVLLLHVFAMVALLAGEAEEALLEDGVAAVPERQGEAEARIRDR